MKKQGLEEEEWQENLLYRRYKRYSSYSRKRDIIVRHSFVYFGFMGRHRNLGREMEIQGERYLPAREFRLGFPHSEGCSWNWKWSLFTGNFLKILFAQQHIMISWKLGQG